MATIGYATLQIIPSLKGVTEAIEKQVDGKVISVSVEPKVDQRAAEKAAKQTRETVEKHTTDIMVEPSLDPWAADRAGRQAREGVEKHTRDVSVEPKVDPKAADKAGKKTREGVEKHTKDVKVEPKVDPKAADDAGKSMGERVGDALTPMVESAIESMDLGSAISKKMGSAWGSIGTELGEKVVKPIFDDLVEPALAKVANSVAKAASTAAVERLGGVWEKVSGKIADAGRKIRDAVQRDEPDKPGTQAGPEAVDAGESAQSPPVKPPKAPPSARVVKAGELVGDALSPVVESTVSAALDNLDLKGKFTEKFGTLGGLADPVFEQINSSVTEFAANQTKALASSAVTGLAGAWNSVAVSTGRAKVASLGASAAQKAQAAATKVVTAAQWLWNAAMSANPIGLIVAAIAALVAGLVLFFTKTELGQKIWKAFTEYLSIAWEGIKVAFSAAWDAIRVVWDAMVTKAGEVWQGIKDRFTAVVDFVKGLPAAITNAARGMWDGLKAGFVAVLNWIGDKWNSFAETFSFDGPGGLDVKIPKIPRFSDGGYTGNFPIDQVAGVVHGGEFVIQASAQKAIEKSAPGFLDYMNNNGSIPGYAGGGLVAGAAELRKIISERFGISNIGGYRPGGDGYDEHVTGRALDVMVGNNKSQGDAVKDFALSNASAIDLKWVIWRQHLYYPGGGGYDMKTRPGGPTANHMDHVHIFSGPGIANGLRGALKGQKQEPAAAAAPAPGVIDPTSTDTTAASTADATPASSSESSTGGVSLASSFSGLAGTGLSNLGVTTSTQIGSGSQERTFDVGNAVSSAVSGQVSSALGVFGVPDSPGWLQGISDFVGGISVSDKSGKKIIGNGGGAASAIGGAGSLFGNTSAGDGYGGAAPVAASAPAAAATPMPDAAHGGQAGRQPGPVFNTTISAFDTTDAVARWDQKKNELVAAKVGVYG